VAYYAKTQVQHGLEDGRVVTLQPGDELTDEHGFTATDIEGLLAVDAIEEGDEYSGETPRGPLQRRTVATGVEGPGLPDGTPEQPQEENAQPDEVELPEDLHTENTEEK